MPPTSSKYVTVCHQENTPQNIKSILLLSSTIDHPWSLTDALELISSHLTNFVTKHPFLLRLATSSSHRYFLSPFGLELAVPLPVRLLTLGSYRYSPCRPSDLQFNSLKLPGNYK
jgi:hypothetical protein